MAQSLRLRRWQKRALDQLATSTRNDFLAVATPGAGKTTFALTAAARALHEGRARHVVVVAPTAHLKLQWSAAAQRLGLHLDPAWSAATGAYPRGAHGFVATYQQVAAAWSVLDRLSSSAFVILDELHHAGDERSWGDAVRSSFDQAAFRLALSGTPFRSDTRAIPFVAYHLDEAVPDFEYGYADALRDGGVVRPVWFPRIGGTMEWVAPDGAQLEATFDDALDRTRSSQRLRTALSTEGEWLPAVLGRAATKLAELRRQQPDAGGLVIASDQEHAREIADLLDRRFAARAVVATSDDPMASARIAQFAASDRPWIVAVRMVSEGVDIPRLRIGVYATTTTTELFFRQAVGRLVRWTGQHAEEAHLFIPDDPRLRLWAHGIAEARRHSLWKRPREEGERDPDESALDAQVHADDSGQLSLFAALSAVADEGPHPVAGAAPEGSQFRGDDDDDPDLLVELPSPPLPEGATAATGSDVPHSPAQRAALRRHNSGLAAELVRFTGLTHAEVNRRLNSLVGVRRIDDATVDQLERRATHAQSWLRRL